MSIFTDLEKDAASVDGFANENGLIPTRRNGPKPSYQYLVDGWNAEIAATILELNKSRGFRVVGTFADGFTYDLFNDVGIDADGNSWIYVGAGAPNKVVAAGTVPSVGAGYEQVTFNAIPFRERFNTVSEMLNVNTDINITEQTVQTNFYNTSVICDWKITQNPSSNSYNLPLANNSGWFAELFPLLGTMLTPEMVGAFGDLSQEDHTHIQTCLDYFENNEFYGDVVIGKKYLVGDTVKARAFASAVGPGVMKAKNSLNKPVFEIHANYPIRKIQNTTYSKFTIDGNKENQTTDDPFLGAGLVFRADVENPFSNGNPDGKGELENITLDNIRSINCKVSSFAFGKNTFVTRSYTFSNLQGSGSVYGVYLADFCEYITFSMCNFQTNQYGVYDDGSSNISFIGGTYANNTEAGIYSPTTGRNTSKKIVSGIHINHNKRGIWLGDGFGTAAERIDQWIITNSHIMANDFQGVLGVGGSRVIAKDNIFSGNGSASPGTYADIHIFGICREWDVDNIHRNSTGDTKCAVLYENPNASGIDGHSYHKIDGVFEGYTNPIRYTTSANPSNIPINANTNFIQGVFEYWNNPGSPPSSNAANANASVDINKIPLGTICINNADPTGAERWRAIQVPSSATSATGERGIQVSFIREPIYTT